MRTSPSRQAGFSLVEVLIASTILVMLLTNVWMVTQAGQVAAQSGLFNMALNDEVNQTYDRISFAIMAADSDDVDGAGRAPFASTRVEYSSTLGLNDGTVVQGPVEQIEWVSTQERDGRVVWREQIASASPREVTWSNSIPISFKGEVDANGNDDNHNGVIDEGGLGFTKESNRVDIYLTVERPDSNGVRQAEHKISTVMCRN